MVGMQVKVGDQVLLPEYEGTKMTVDEKEYSVFRQSDIIGVFKRGTEGAGSESG